MLVGLVYATPVGILVVLSVLSAAGLTAADIVWESALQGHVDESVPSRVSLYDWLGSLIFAPVGYALIGWSGESVGLVAVMVAVTVSHVISRLLIVLLPGVRSLLPPSHATPT